MRTDHLSLTVSEENAAICSTRSQSLHREEHSRHCTGGTMQFVRGKSYASLALGKIICRCSRCGVQGQPVPDAFSHMQLKCRGRLPRLDTMSLGTLEELFIFHGSLSKQANTMFDGIFSSETNSSTSTTWVCISNSLWLDVSRRRRQPRECWTTQMWRDFKQQKEKLARNMSRAMRAASAMSAVDDGARAVENAQPGQSLAAARSVRSVSTALQVLTCWLRSAAVEAEKQRSV